MACDLKFSKRETILIHIKLHEDVFDIEQVTLTDTTCPECNSVSMRFIYSYPYVYPMYVYCIPTSIFGGIVVSENYDLVPSRLKSKCFRHSRTRK